MPDETPSALARLVIQVAARPIAPSPPKASNEPAAPSVPVARVAAIPDSGGASSVAPKRLDQLREFVREGVLREPTPEAADLRLAATLLGWVQSQGSEPGTVTEAGAQLLTTEPGSDAEATAFATAVLEHPPICRITSALLLGEWLELRDLGPALAQQLGLHPAQAARLMPCVLAWRDELRRRGWAPRQVALHLRTRTAWMTGLSARGREVLARQGVFTPQRVLAWSTASHWDQPGTRPETLREIERFRVSLEGPPSPAKRGRTETRDDASILLRRLNAFELSSRARHVLHELGAVCIGDVIAIDRAVLMGRPHCGRKTVDEIAALVEGLGLRLGTPVEAAVERVAPSPQRAAPLERAAPPQRVDVAPREPAPAPEPEVDLDVRPDAIDASSILAAARRLIGERGCASIGALARECADLPDATSDLDVLRDLLAEDADVRWLDDDRAWFSIAGVRTSPLVARLGELLRGDALAPAVLRDALARDPKLGRHLPPSSVLVALGRILGAAPEPPTPQVVAAPVRAAELVDPRITIDGSSTVEALATAAGISVEELVARALGADGFRRATQRAG